jgi:hypothetical protein
MPEVSGARCWYWTLPGIRSTGIFAAPHAPAVYLYPRSRYKAVALLHALSYRRRRNMAAEYSAPRRGDADFYQHASQVGGATAEQRENLLARTADEMIHEFNEHRVTMYTAQTWIGHKTRQANAADSVSYGTAYVSDLTAADRLESVDWDDAWYDVLNFLDALGFSSEPKGTDRNGLHGSYRAPPKEFYVASRYLLHAYGAKLITRLQLQRWDYVVSRRNIRYTNIQLRDPESRESKQQADGTYAAMVPAPSPTEYQWYHQQRDLTYDDMRLDKETPRTEPPAGLTGREENQEWFSPPFPPAAGKPRTYPSHADSGKRPWFNDADYWYSGPGNNRVASRYAGHGSRSSGKTGRQGKAKKTASPKPSLPVGASAGTQAHCYGCGTAAVTGTCGTCAEALCGAHCPLAHLCCVPAVGSSLAGARTPATSGGGKARLPLGAQRRAFPSERMQTGPLYDLLYQLVDADDIGQICAFLDSVQATVYREHGDWVPALAPSKRPKLSKSDASSAKSAAKREKAKAKVDNVAYVAPMAEYEHWKALHAYANARRIESQTNDRFHATVHSAAVDTARLGVYDALAHYQKRVKADAAVARPMQGFTYPVAYTGDTQLNARTAAALRDYARGLSNERYAGRTIRVVADYYGDEAAPPYPEGETENSASDDEVSTGNTFRLGPPPPLPTFQSSYLSDSSEFLSAGGAPLPVEARRIRAATAAVARGQRGGGGRRLGAKHGHDDRHDGAGPLRSDWMVAMRNGISEGDLAAVTALLDPGTAVAGRDLAELGVLIEMSVREQGFCAAAERGSPALCARRVAIATALMTALLDQTTESDSDETSDSEDSEDSSAE